MGFMGVDGEWATRRDSERTNALGVMLPVLKLQQIMKF